MATPSNTKPKPVKIFIAYSRLDGAYLDALRKHLKPLDRNRSIQIWYDGEIVPGSEWEQTIKDNLHAADIILLLVSANSLASDYFYDKEMADALARHEREEAIVVPIILSHCAWDITDLSELQALPQDGKPISDWTDASKAYTNVVRGLNKSVKAVKDKQKAANAAAIAQQKAAEAEQQRILDAQKEQERLEALKRQAVEQEERQKLEAERHRKELEEQERLRQLELEKEREKIAQQKAEAEQKRLSNFKKCLLEADKNLIIENWLTAVVTYQKSLQFYKIGDTPSQSDIKEKIKIAQQKYRQKQFEDFKTNPKIRYPIIGLAAIMLFFFLVWIASEIGKTPSTTDSSGLITSSFEEENDDSNPIDTSNLHPEIQKLLDNMVTVQGGTFKMGSNDGQDDEKPVHSVTLSSYQIGKYEVTQAQWRAVMGSDPEDLRFKGCANCPVENVSWNDIQDFLKKLNAKTGKNFRLPTEAEWEFAARGGNKSRNYTYAGSNSIGDVAWYGSNSSDKTHPVGGKKANELGLYDMSGNVWEWCNDRYDKNYYANSPSKNPHGASSSTSRVLRGGSWVNHDYYCRVSNRDLDTPSNRNSDLGFRLAQ